MPLEIKKGIKEMVAEANAAIETVSVEQARALHGTAGVTFIDLRDPRELWRDGGVPGAVNVTRGMLEFWVDPESPYYKDVFAPGKTFVFYCQSGWRSALATRTVQEMGLPNVCHVGGGYRAWKDAGAETEAQPPRGA